MPIDRSKAPEYSIPADFDLSSPIEGQTHSGVPYYYFHTPSIEAVKIEVIGKGSRNQLPLNHLMVPSFTLQMLQEGTRNKTDHEIGDLLDFHASEIGIHLSYTQEGINLLSTKKHIFQVLPTFLDLFQSCTFPELILEKRKKQRKLSLQLDYEKSSVRSSILFRKALFGEDHYFGAETKEAHIDVIDRSLLENYYQNLLWNELEIFISGNFSNSELDLLINQLDSIPNRKTTINNSSIPPQTSITLVEEREDALQSSIRIGSWSIPKTHPDFQALSIFNTILGGYFGSRLVKNIREDKGHTYGISSNLAEIGDFNYWIIGADVAKSHRDQVLAEIKIEIQKLASDPISSEELEIVRNYLIGQMLSRFSTPFDLVDRFKSVHFSGLDLQYYQEKLNFLKTFTGEQIQKVGRRYFNTEDLIEVWVG